MTGRVASCDQLSVTADRTIIDGQLSRCGEFVQVRGIARTHCDAGDGRDLEGKAKGCLGDLRARGNSEQP